MTVAVYHLTTINEERSQLVSYLAHNLHRNQLPFVFINRVDSVSCQIVLYDEQLTILKLAVPSLTATRLLFSDEDNI